MDVERSSLCNCVVNFLLEENYLLSAFELLHELLDDGRDAQAIRLKEFFTDPSHFPPDQISRFNTLRVVDPQSLLEEKEATEAKLAISGYELRLAQEDITRLKNEVQRRTESPPETLNGSSTEISANEGLEFQQRKGETSFSDLGPLKDSERWDLNCAVKEYLLLGGYRLTAMTFYEEVTDQNLDVWQKTPACVPDALRHYYYQYLSSTSEAAEVIPESDMAYTLSVIFVRKITRMLYEKIAMLRENDALRKTNERLSNEKESLRKAKELSDGQIMGLTRSLETLQKDLKDREILVQGLKQSLDLQRKELNDCRAEITSLKMHIEGSQAGRVSETSDVDYVQSQAIESYKAELNALQIELDGLKENKSVVSNLAEQMVSQEHAEPEDKVVEIHEDKGVVSNLSETAGPFNAKDAVPVLSQDFEEKKITSDVSLKISQVVPESGPNLPLVDGGLLVSSDNIRSEPISEKGLETIQILSDSLPKIVPYVLINHREELLPLMMCAIERHPDSSTRDSLTHTLFNLIKRPDEQQRRIIMDACVTLAKNVGHMRTETELLPQCWEQINHMYEERRLLVAQSCGELAEFVRPEIRDSLILSIIQQLIEDSAMVVREAAAHNLALLLPLFPNMDKYFKVEELMFQLVCDPSGAVVDTSLRELLPAVVNWGNKLEHILKVLLSYLLESVQRCPPLSGVEGSVESHLRVLGERERWNSDVLLRMLIELLPRVHQNAIETCPLPAASPPAESFFSSSLLESYAGKKVLLRGGIEWPAFDWMHVECFPSLIELTCLLPAKEDNLRIHITRYLLAVAEKFGDHYATHIMLPVFLVAVGDDADLTLFPPTALPRIKGLHPKSAFAEKLATMCVLPLLLAGILGAPCRHEQLAEYFRKILVQRYAMDDQSAVCSSEIANGVRFLCTFEVHHTMIFNTLWEMVVSSNINMKISAANLLKVIVPYIDAKGASTHVLPALVTLGSDQNLTVKYASIEAFGAVAQHFKNDVIVDKIRVQMDAFLEDGSHEATIAVVRALLVAVPHTTDRLRDYILIFQLTSAPMPGSDMMRHRERANAFCESIRALDATDLPANSIRDLLLPTIQNLLKDPDAIDPAHREALEIIMRERSGGTFEAISKVMGVNIGLASSMTSFFGEGLLGKKEASVDQPPAPAPVEPPKPAPPPPAEDTRFRRIMRGSFTEMLRGQSKAQ
ncbi:hypothetical protein RJ641_006507 [Dillenia turbinata]|uniref:LisH domain-containing protein n=1 Tax=Dillenia turbinata TaxID=194707 RepID=A0AAN8Z7M2_9MAGN